MQALQAENLNNASRITSLVRSAVFLGATLECNFVNGKGSFRGLIAKVSEIGAGRNLIATGIDIQPLNKEVSIESEAQLHVGSEFDSVFIVGDLKVIFKSKITSVSSDFFTIAIPTSITLRRNRKAPRRMPNLSADGWGLIEGRKFSTAIRISLKDYTSVGLGFVISSQTPLKLEEYNFIFGVVSSNNLSMRIEGAKIIRISPISDRTADGWIFYKVGCQLEYNKAKNRTVKNGRISRRFNQGDHIRLESEFLPGRHYKAKIKDISIRGLSCELLFTDDITAFPKGAPIRITNIGIQGRVIESKKLCLRIALDFNCSKTFQSWFLRFTEAFHPTMDTWVDFFHQAAISFASSGGVSSEYLRNAGSINRYLEPQMIKLDHNPHWMQMWVEKNSDGNVIGHISCVRYGDNIWYVGDIWGSQLSNIDKDFIKNFFESFVSYTLVCAPFPKTIVTLKLGHPYWQRMLTALDKKKQEYIIEDSLCYKVPLFERKNFSSSRRTKVEVINPLDSFKINEVLRLLEAEGTRSLAEYMGFSIDGFGSPLLRSVLLESKYNFERLYIIITNRSGKFLAIFSKYPGGTSIQHHQETIWLFSITKGQITRDLFEEIINTAAKFCLKLGIFPAYIKLVTKKKIQFLPEPMRLIVGDPRMWLLL